MHQDELKLNDEKTEFLLIGTRQQLAKVSINSIKVGSVDVSSAREARVLGVRLDSKLTMSTHINKTCGAAFLNDPPPHLDRSDLYLNLVSDFCFI